MPDPGIPDEFLRFCGEQPTLDDLPRRSRRADKPSQAAVETAHWELQGTICDYDEDAHAYHPIKHMDEEDVVRVMLEAAYAVDACAAALPNMDSREDQNG